MLVRVLKPIRLGCSGKRLMCLDAHTKECVWLARWKHAGLPIQWQIVTDEHGGRPVHADPRDHVDLSDVRLTPCNPMHSALAAVRPDVATERAWRPRVETVVNLA